MSVVVFCFFFFFFQAEDGIRDHCVTGVQTCALPICEGVRSRGGRERPAPHGRDAARVAGLGCAGDAAVPRSDRERRSEERRVGKECRSWWAPDHEKKKM